MSLAPARMLPTPRIALGAFVCLALAGFPRGPARAQAGPSLDVDPASGAGAHAGAEGDAAQAERASGHPELDAGRARDAGGPDPGAASATGAAPTAPDAGHGGRAGSNEDRSDEADDDSALVLPPVPPGRPPNPAVDEVPPPPEVPFAPEQRTGVVIKTILGLVALLGLAYVGGHPRVQRVERTLGISQVITAGFPFVALGVIARHPGVGVLTDPVLAALGPLLRLGLGWIGFIIGFRFDATLLQNVPSGIGAFVAARAFAAFSCVVGVSAVVLLGAQGITREALTDPVFLRDALILGSAAAITSLATPHLLRARGGDEATVRKVARVVRLEEMGGIVGLLLIAAYFRPQGAQVSWQLPGTAWLLLTLGAGVAIGLLCYAILLRTTADASESLVLILGSVAFGAGLASNLRLSPVVVCFVAGLLLANFPGDYKVRLAETLRRLERPVYLLFLLVVGALWDVSDWRGWVLMACFVAARFAGKWLGTQLGLQVEGFELGPEGRVALVVAPMGALSIAIVVNAELLYPGGSIPQIVTAIVGGAIVTELLVQLVTRSRGASATSTPAPGVPSQPGTPR